MCGFPAESPDTLEPSRQFDESLHCCGRGLDLSHNELEWITKPPNYLTVIKNNMSATANLVENKRFKYRVWAKRETTTIKKCFGLFEVTYFGKVFQSQKPTTGNTKFNTTT